MGMPRDDKLLSSFISRDAYSVCTYLSIILLLYILKTPVDMISWNFQQIKLLGCVTCYFLTIDNDMSVIGIRNKSRLNPFKLPSRVRLR